MSEKKKRDDKKTREKEIIERRISQRFAWLGPLMERRKTEVQPLGAPEEDEEPEEVEE